MLACHCEAVAELTPQIRQVFLTSQGARAVHKENSAHLASPLALSKAPHESSGAMRSFRAERTGDVKSRGLGLSGPSRPSERPLNDNILGFETRESIEREAREYG